MPQQVTSSPFYAAQPIPNGGGGGPGGFGLGSGSQDPSHVNPGYGNSGGGFGGGGGGLGANPNVNANAPPMGTSFPRHGSFHGSSPLAGPSRWAGSGDPAGVMSGLSILKSRRDRLVTSPECHESSPKSCASSRSVLLYRFLTHTYPPAALPTFSYRFLGRTLSLPISLTTYCSLRCRPLLPGAFPLSCQSITPPLPLYLRSLLLI
jgi:hypothetical protein